MYRVSDSGRERYSGIDNASVRKLTENTHRTLADRRRDPFWEVFLASKGRRDWFWEVDFVGKWRYAREFNGEVTRQESLKSHWLLKVFYGYGVVTWL